MQVSYHYASGTCHSEASLHGSTPEECGRDGRVFTRNKSRTFKMCTFCHPGFYEISENPQNSYLPFISLTFCEISVFRFLALFGGICSHLAIF